MKNDYTHPLSGTSKFTSPKSTSEHVCRADCDSPREGVLQSIIGYSKAFKVKKTKKFGVIEVVLN